MVTSRGTWWSSNQTNHDEENPAKKLSNGCQICNDECVVGADHLFWYFAPFRKNISMTTISCINQLVESLSFFRQELKSELDSESTSQSTASVTLAELNPLWGKLDLEPGLWIAKHVVPAFSRPSDTKPARANVLWGKHPTANDFHSVILRGSGPYQHCNPTYSDLEKFVPLTGAWIEHLSDQRRQMAGDVDQAYQLRQTGSTWSEIARLLSDRSDKAWSAAVRRYAKELNLPLRIGNPGRPSKL